jgi:hypothetical protein
MPTVLDVVDERPDTAGMRGLFGPIGDFWAPQERVGQLRDLEARSAADCNDQPRHSLCGGDVTGLFTRRLRQRMNTGSGGIVRVSTRIGRLRRMEW